MDDGSGERRAGARTARRVRVHGTVQGVFFRASCRERAERAGVVGWVRNEADGSVTAELEGPAEAVEDVVAWCRSGPERAEVRGVEVSGAVVEGHDTFEVR